MFKSIKGIYNKSLNKRRREIYFIILIFFLLMFGLSRLYVWLSYTKFEGHLFKALLLGNYHIHHFYYGVIFIIASSFIAIFTGGIKSARVAAIFLGVGLGLFFDEIGLLLNEFKLDYYVTEHIVWIWGVIIALLLIAIVFDKDWLIFEKPKIYTFEKIKENIQKKFKQ